MTRDEILALCRKAPDVGQVKHEDFIDYIVAVEQRRQVNGEWQTVERAYMTVDGKLAMANLDHRLQGKRLEFQDPIILVDDEEQVTLLVTIDSEIYGRRHGIATGRRVSGSQIEQEHPWEVAETSAIGRALTAMGYGLLPGAGLSSAEDVLRAAEREEAPAQPTAPQRRERVAALRQPAVRARAAAATPTRRRISRVSRYQRQKLIELYSEIEGVEDEEAALAAINGMFVEAFGHGIDEATYQEGARITAQLLAQKRELANNSRAA
ncbi:MAG: hypothetical protein D6791_02195 [Chloroflexi bacterium]|nr:MAG: hypothetical protein D6791_02195 [Chloroflexota bacterium]